MKAVSICGCENELYRSAHLQQSGIQNQMKPLKGMKFLSNVSGKVLIRP